MEDMSDVSSLVPLSSASFVLYDDGVVVEGMNE